MGTEGNWSEAMDAKLEELRRDPEGYYQKARGRYVPEGTALPSDSVRGKAAAKGGARSRRGSR